MEPNKGNESGEMYLPDDQGEYGTDVGASSFTVQGLSDALTILDTGVTEVTEVAFPAGEFTLQPEVTMVNHPGHPCPPTFLWNMGMVMHVLKSDSTLLDLKHVQVDGPSTAYLFFFNKQGCRGLSFEATQAMRTHVGDTFTEWISCAAHFAVNPLPLVEGWCHMVTVSEWCRHRLRTEFQPQVIPCLATSEWDSTQQLVGSALPSAMRVGPGDEAGGVHITRTASTRPHGRLPKAKPIREGGNSPPSSSDRGVTDSDEYSTVSEAVGGQHRRRRQRDQKCLTPACLDMPIFKSTDPNVDVTFTTWKFDIQGWLDQYDEVSMMPHINSSLQQYPGKWVHSLEEGRNIMVRELLEHMDVTFGNVHDFMIRYLYEIQQKEVKSMEEYMLKIHEAVVVICCAHPDHVSDQGKNLQ